MKKIFLLIILFISTFSLTSCSPSTSYKDLSKVENEIEEDYITFGKDGIVLNGNYKELKYEDFFDDYTNVGAYKSEDYLVAVTVYGEYFYQTKYNIKNKSFIKYEMKLENSKSSKFVCSNKYTGLISYGKDYVDTGYVIDADFNIKSTILTDEPNIITNVNFSNDAVLFTIDKKDEINLGNNNYKIESFYQKIIYYNNEFYNLGWEDSNKNDLIINNYRVEIDKDDYEIEYIYDFVNDEKISEENEDIYNYINEKVKEDPYIVLPNFSDVEKGNKFYHVLHSYCSSAKWSKTFKVKVEDNYYYIVKSNVNISYQPWIIRGDTDYKELEPSFIFKYNKENNDLLYVGFAKGDVISFYTY